MHILPLFCDIDDICSFDVALALVRELVLPLDK
jgi:hypothetical protein